MAGEPTGVDLDRDRGGAATVVAVVPPGWESWEDVPLSEDELWELRFGDDGGDLSAEQLDALMARLPAGALDDPEMDGDGDDPPGAPGMLGLMPRDVPAGGGFDAGGVADRLPPGLALAALAERTWQAGLARLDDDELVGLALAWRRLQSWATAAELAAIAALASRRDRQAAAAGDAGIAEHFGDELAMAMTLTGRSAAALLDFATAMATLPATSNALAAGVIDRGKAHVIADELSGLDRVQAARVEAQLLGNAGSQTTSQLRAAAKRTVLKTDPAAAKKRHEAARRNARVEVWHEPSGTASLAGRDLPPADVLAADQRITALARRLKATGHHGTLDQLRAQAYTSLLLGHPADGPATAEHSAAAGNRATATEAGTTTAANAKAGTARAGTGASRSGTPHAGPGGTGPPGTAAAGTARDGTGTCGSKPPHARPVGTGSASTGSAGTAAPGTAAPGTATVGTAAVGTGTASNGSPGSPQEAQPSGLRGSVNLTVPLATLLGISESPGDLAGLGPIHADDARALAAALATRPGNRWCLTLTGPDGRAIAHGCTTTAAKRTTNRAGKVGGDESGSGGGRGHGDSSGGDRGGGGNGGGRGGGGGGGGGSSGGRGGGSSGGDRGGGGNGGGRGGGRGGGGGSSGGRGGGGSSSGETGASSTGPPWPLTFNLTPLATGTCSHRLETAGYHPTHLLRHTLHVRQRTCSAPGCRRQAVNCDLDHTTPYAKGGRTCECGLAPLCRRHHRAKQTYGWKLEQPHPGVLVWRLPHGRTYRVEPDPYPV